MQNVLSRVKRVIYRFYMNDALKKDKRNISVQRFGSDYGGFDVCTEYIQPNAIVYSFGIGEDLSFSQALHDKFDVNIYAFDPTPKSKKYVESHPLYASNRFHFEYIGLSDVDEYVKFYLPENESYVSGSAFSHKGSAKVPIEVSMKCLDTISKELGHDHIDILKMDIEGSEFKVVDGLNKVNIPIGQICLEVHNRFFENGKELLKKMDNCLQEKYALVSVSDNVEELTYVNRDLIR